MIINKSNSPIVFPDASLGTLTHLQLIGPARLSLAATIQQASHFPHKFQ